jgi:uncharacterized protein (DUF3084 family)
LIAIPVFCFHLAAASGALAADIQAKIDQINAREKQLIEKLEAAQQRVRDIENKLAVVRQRKQELLNKQALRLLGKSPVATPSALAP